ncbi:MAG: NDP-sugar synthase [Opitutales bacterium]
MASSVAPTLLVLAAGMGSRFGGLKQLEPLGPAGETLLDYAVFDARAAGFGRVVFVIRESFGDAFREQVLGRLPGDLGVDLVYQETDRLPFGSRVAVDRQKPWGTGHAVLVAAAQVEEPFAVINADDFYGRAAYARAAEFFRASRPGDWPLPLALVAFSLGQTLSPHGSVSRGICEVDAAGLLTGMSEHLRITPDEGGSGALSEGPDGTVRQLPAETPASMNFFVFQPGVFAFLDAQFRQFLETHGDDPRAEFQLPTAVGAMIRRGQASVRVLRSAEAWMGVTYPGDRETVRARLAERVAQGQYPSPLWAG